MYHLSMAAATLKLGMLDLILKIENLKAEK